MATSTATAVRLPTTRRHIWAATILSFLASLGLVAVEVPLLLRGGEPFSMELRQVVVWDAWALAYLLLTWRILPRMDATAMRDWAGGMDRGRRGLRDKLLGRAVGFSLPAYGALYGFGVAAWVLPRARDLMPGRAWPLLVLSILAVVGAWCVMHTGFTMHYAYLYYRRGEGGLDFPGTGEPAAMDFAYFASAVATTFGTTDVNVTSGRLRRVVFGHALVSFVFNTGILAITLTLLVP